MLICLFEQIYKNQRLKSPYYDFNESEGITEPKKHCLLTYFLKVDSVRFKLKVRYLSCYNCYISMLKNNKNVFVGPSILSADFGELAKDCQEIIDLGAESLHIDIMDG